MIHLEGMGLQGSMLAWHLWAQGTPFTWHDIDTKYRAWEASSGLVYPDGAGHAIIGKQMWSEWLASTHKFMEGIRPFVGESAFWYCTKSAPNNSKSPAACSVNGLTRSLENAYNVDVPGLVRSTRTWFYQEQRHEAPEDAALIVVTHGFSKPRLNHVVWGWTSAVDLWIDSAIREACGELRPTFYFRPTRFQFGYANAKPQKKPEWIGGSATIVQHHAHELQMKDKMDRWIQLMEDASGGNVRVTDISKPVIGWRPAPHPHPLVDYSWASLWDWSTDLRTAPHRLYLPAMEGNGVRLSPLVMRDAIHKLNEYLVVGGIR